MPRRDERHEAITRPEAPHTDAGLRGRDFRVRNFRGRLLNWLLAALSLLCFSIGWVGLFVPGLPTTIFWILAALLAGRSCPWVRQKVYAFGRVGRSVRLFIEHHAMTPAGKRAALLGMAGGLGLSILVLQLTTEPAWWLTTLILAVGVIGAGYITLGVRTVSTETL